MTHIEAMAAIAQGIVNIDYNPKHSIIEKDSRIYRGMLAIIEEEKKTIEALREIDRLLSGDVKHGSRVKAIAIVKRMIAERTDPEFGHG